MVSGTVMWERDLYEARFDAEMQYLSHFTANIMLSSGNYKRNTKIERIKESLYIPLEDREAYEKKHRHSDGVKPNRSEGKKAPTDKVAELKERFNL